MRTPFRLGLGGTIGSGLQWMSWIAIDDLVAMVQFLLEHQEIEGPVNVVSPVPVINAVFTHILAKELKRPEFLHIPAWLCKILFGEFGQEALLSSIRVLPQKMIQAGFGFTYPDLQRALSHILSKKV
jgi:uncharacterized protein (TIGR01777 family)